MREYAPQCAVSVHRAAFGPPPARAARLQDIDLMRIGQGYRNDFCNRLAVGEMTGSGQTLPSRDFCGTAALPLKPDIAWHGWHGRKVPQPDSCTATKYITIRSPRRRGRVEWAG